VPAYSRAATVATKSGAEMAQGGHVDRNDLTMRDIIRTRDIDPQVGGGRQTTRRRQRQRLTHNTAPIVRMSSHDHVVDDHQQTRAGADRPPATAVLTPRHNRQHAASDLYRLRTSPVSLPPAAANAGDKRRRNPIAVRPAGPRSAAGSFNYPPARNSPYSRSTGQPGVVAGAGALIKPHGRCLGGPAEPTGVAAG